MRFLQRVLQSAAAVNSFGFHLAAACLLLMVLSCAGLVIVRYGFGLSSIAVQEGVMYLHALVLSLGLAGTWQRDGHVRIDIFYRGWNAQRQLWLNRICALLLALPFAVFVLWSCYDYVDVAWQRRESSAEPGGLAWLWLLKSLMLVFPLQLLAAALWASWRNPQSAVSQETPE